MALSEHEQRVLDEIEDALRKEDPRFGLGVEELELRPRLGIKVVALMALGLVLLVAGIVASPVSQWFVLLSVAGFLLMFGAGVWGLRGKGVQASVGAKGTKASRQQRKPRVPRGSGSLEEDFRRRFER